MQLERNNCLNNKRRIIVDSTDYYNRYAVPHYEETDASMEEVMKPFVELLSEESENAEVLDLGCGSGRDTLLLKNMDFM